MSHPYHRARTAHQILRIPDFEFRVSKGGLPHALVSTVRRLKKFRGCGRWYLAARPGHA
jgi:hypothetical protein